MSEKKQMGRTAQARRLELNHYGEYPRVPHRGTESTLEYHCAGVGNAGATALAERLPTQRPSLHELVAQRSLLRCCEIVL